MDNVHWASIFKTKKDINLRLEIELAKRVDEMAEVSTGDDDGNSRSSLFSKPSKL